MSLGAFAPSTGRQLGLHCGAGGAVEGEAGTLFTRRPAPPCWAEAGGGPRVIARHYIDKICCPRYGHLAGRSLWAAGRHATCKLVGSAEGGECKKSIAAGGRVPLKMAHRSYCSLSSHSITAHTGVQLLILGYDCLPSVFTANIEYNIIGQDSKEFETLVPSTVMIHLMNRKILLFNRSILSWLLESHRTKKRPFMPGGLDKNDIFDMDIGLVIGSFQSSVDNW